MRKAQFWMFSCAVLMCALTSPGAVFAEDTAENASSTENAPQVESASESAKESQIPEGEANFTKEQYEMYYRCYKEPEVKYLRKALNAYLDGKGGTQAENSLLEKWDKEYFKSKFIVLSLDKCILGGRFVTLMFQEKPDKVFVAWLYSPSKNSIFELRSFELGKFSDEDIRRINVRYRKFHEDKVHAM